MENHSHTDSDTPARTPHCALLLAAGIALAASATGAADLPLLPGDRVERVLRGGESHAFTAAVPEGQLLEARLTEDGSIHVSVSLESADGVERLPAADRVAAVSEAPGLHRLVVRPLREDAPSGHYVLEIAARPASETDRLRFAGALRMAEGRRTQAPRNPDALRRAEETYLEAQRLYEQAGDLAGQFDAVTMVGEIADNRGDMATALARYEQGLALAQEAGDELLQSDARSWMGLALGHLGRIDAALENVQWALAAARRHGDRRREGYALNTLAFVYGERQTGDEYAALIEEALPLLAEYGDVGSVAQAHNNLGFHYVNFRDGERAVAHHREALRLRRQRGVRNLVAQSLNNLGSATTEALDRPAEALPILAEALSTAHAAGDRLTQAWSMDALGLAHTRLGRLDEAMAGYESALTVWRDLDSPRGAAHALLGIGEIREQRGDNARARDCFREALDLSRRADTPRGQMRSHLGLARLALAEGDLPGARREAEAAVQVIESARTTYARDQLRAAYFAVVRPAYDLLVDLLMRSGDVAGAFQASERSRARTLLEAVAADPAAPLPAPPLAGVADVQRQLEPDTVFVEYALGESRSYAWVIRRDGFTSVVLEGREAIEDSARQLLRHLTARNTATGADAAARRKRITAADAALPAAAGDLARRILRPLSLPRARRLVVVADGALQYVPFSVLPGTASGGRLVDVQQVMVLPSASVLSALRATPRPQGPGGTVAVLADPVFRRDDPRVGRAPAPTRVARSERALLRSAEESGVAALPRLRFSRREAQAIAALVPRRVQLFLDFEASRDALGSDEVRAAQVVHFATHGLLNSRNPERTGLVLSMVDRVGGARDGFLRLEDVQRLRLQADLVVLSACQTALGKDVQGEGLVGLTRSFMVAGAPRIVSSLWQVDDHATAELMKRFYAAFLGRGLPPAAALREAQRGLAADPRWRAPYYWAAFTFNGEWN